MTLPIVLICDDDANRAANWKSQVDAMDGLSQLDVRVLATTEFAEAILALGRRREAARDGGSVSGDAADVLDKAAMLIVDYDLTIGAEDTLGQAQPETVKAALRGQSGEQFAYLARCYSRTGFIVLVNQEYKRRTFDLTMQRFAQSYADLNVQWQDIVLEGLWKGTGSGYRPSHWPRLVDVPMLHARRLAATELSNRVLETLGIRGRDLAALDARQLDPLAADGDPSQVAFDQLVDGVDGGLDPKDQQPDPEIRRSIAASAASRWLESIVLPAQNVLADASHLAQRFPSLAGADDGSVWRQLGRWDGGIPPGLETATRLANEWASRPVWSLADIRESVRASEGPLVEPARQAFCEDTSDFRDYGEAHEFQSDLPGPYDQRFVTRLDDVSYHPLRRLLTRP